MMHTIGYTSVPRIKSFNGFIATVPLGVIEGKKTKRIAGMSLIDEKVSLLPLKVLFDSEDYSADDTIYIDGNTALNHAWAKAIYTIDGHEFILVPKNFVVLASVTVKPSPYAASLGGLYGFSNIPAVEPGETATKVEWYDPNGIKKE